MASEFQYHEWLCKTNFSFLKGASHPLSLLQTAVTFAYDSLCVNDFDGAYGLARTYNDLQNIRRRTGKNIKLNYGAEVHLRKDHDQPLLKQATVALNAISWEGYRNLCQILSLSHRDSKNEAFLSVEVLLQQNLKDLFVIVPMRGGLDYFVQNSLDLATLKEATHNQVYLALSKTFHRSTDIKARDVYRLAEQFQLGCLFSQDIFFCHRSDKAFHDVLTAIQQNRKVEESLAYFFPNGERSFHSKDQLHAMFRAYPHFNRNLQLMAELNEKSQFCLSQIKYQYPKEFIPEGFTAQTYLEKVTWDGARQRYGAHLSPQVVSSLARELDIIEELGFADYFLTVWDIVAWARSQDILCQGRGSAANSSVCYVLGVTSCDPSLFDLLFERFVSKERGDPPDIDVDFEHERREEVIQYIYRRYGRKKAAMVANVICFQTKGAMRAVGKAFGLSESILKKAADISSTVMFRREGFGDLFNELRRTQPNLKTPPHFSWNYWQLFAERIRGYPRHIGLHSGGFIISQHEIDSLVPQEPATMEGRTVIQWAKDDIEELGFFKIDCLALGMLTALRKCFQQLREVYGVDLSMYSIPQDDLPTYAMIQKADTVGVFQIESRAQMSMLPRLKPKCFYDLVIEIAIIRPGPIQGKVIHPYLKRRDGTEPVTYPTESMKDVLAKTLGIILFQEQLMRIAIVLGDFTPGEANELRKHIGAWNSKAFNRDLNQYIEKLLQGLKKKNIDPAFTEQMIAQMRGFAHYGFPESHSISFAFIAYASCYLKCHYPAAFFMAVLNSQPMGFYSPHALLQAARRQKIVILPITVNDSQWDHQLEELPSKESAKEFRPKIFAIRLGFRLISGLSRKAVDHLVEVRNQEGPWKDFRHFLQTTSIYRDDYSAMAAANAFQCLGLNRFDALWKAEAVPFKDLVDVEERTIRWKDKDVFQMSQLDFQAFGTTLETHPVKVLRQSYWCYGLKKENISSALQLEDLKSNRMVSIFGMALVRQAPPSAKGMVFFTLEDETGFINLAFAPQVYKKFYHLIERSGFLCVSGKLQKAGKYHSILVSVVHPEERSKITALHVREQKTWSHTPSLKTNPRNYY